MENFKVDDNIYLNDDHHSKLKNECIIAYKVYDQCSQQDCLTPSMLGPARSAEKFNCRILTPNTIPVLPELIRPGFPIDPSIQTAAVKIVKGSFLVKEVRIVGVEPREFANDGYWDVDLKFVFSYKLQFFDAGMNVISIECDTATPGVTTTQDFICASSIFNKKVTLFGSRSEDFIVASTLFTPQSNTLSSAPYVWVEAKGLALDAKIKYTAPVTIGSAATFNPNIADYPATPTQIDVTLGLFTIIKLFRLVNLSVKSTGFCKPEPCIEISSDPCEFFNSLDFPFSVFNPPQKEDFCND